MKKFFQIAAFAVVGFIAFTSATNVGLKYWVISTPTTNPLLCNQPVDDQIQVAETNPEAVQYYALRKIGGAFVTNPSITDPVVYMQANGGSQTFTCDRLFLIEQ